MRSLRDVLEHAARDRRDWWNGPGFAAVLVGMMFVGLVAVAIALGWVRP